MTTTVEAVVEAKIDDARAGRRAGGARRSGRVERKLEESGVIDPDRLEKKAGISSEHFPP